MRMVLSASSGHVSMAPTWSLMLADGRDGKCRMKAGVVGIWFAVVDWKLLHSLVKNVLDFDAYVCIVVTELPSLRLPFSPAPVNITTTKSIDAYRRPPKTSVFSEAGVVCHRHLYLFLSKLRNVSIPFEPMSFQDLSNSLLSVSGRQL